MKNYVLRLVSFFMVVVMLAGVMPAVRLYTTVFASETPEEFVEGDYKYTVTDEIATITRYTGDGGCVTIPDELGGYPVTVIGEGSFSAYTYNLTSVVIPDSVEIIEGSAFSQCQRLQGVTFGSGLKSIGGYAFYNCAVQNPTFPEGLVSIGGSAFEKGCNGRVYIPGSVEYVANMAFYKSRVGSVVFGDGVGEVGDFAFNECQGLTTVTFEGSVKSFGNDAFAKSNHIKKVYVEDLSAWLKIKFKDVYSSPMSSGVGFYINGEKLNGSIVIPEEISDCSGRNLSNMGIKKAMLLNEKFPVSKFTTSSIMTAIYAYDVNGNRETVEEAGITFVDLADFDCENGRHCYDFYGVTEVQKVSCEQEGISREICALCGNVKETKTEKWEHVFPQGWITESYPTCSEPGLKYRRCMLCRTYTVTEEIPEKAHSLRTLEGKEATCTQTGLTEGKLCYQCEEVTVPQTVIPKKSHTVVKDKAVSATYSKTGLTEGSHCSVCGKVLMAQNTVSKLTLSKVDGLKAKDIKVAKSSEIKLSWNKVSGAEKYEVYIKNGSKWTRLTSTGKTSYTVKKDGKKKSLKADKEYQFRVRAVVDEASGAYSSVLKVETIPETTSKLTLKVGKKQLTAYWSKVSGISGYEVQYSTSKKFTKKTTKTVSTKSSSKKTTLKKLSKGKKYYVRIRTYNTVNGKKIYSDWSKTKNISVK
ncbi:MAG: fibronectin type III domain-containing protein [Clostridia bacterium]|nr:fibronectin type III domain-containing protein [Clostridia bacterium]